MEGELLQLLEIITVDPLPEDSLTQRNTTPPATDMSEPEERASFHPRNGVTFEGDGRAWPFLAQCKFDDLYDEFVGQTVQDCPRIGLLAQCCLKSCTVLKESRNCRSESNSGHDY